MAIAMPMAVAISEPRMSAAASIARAITATRMAAKVVFKRPSTVDWFAGASEIWKR